MSDFHNNNNNNNNNNIARKPDKYVIIFIQREDDVSFHWIRSNLLRCLFSCCGDRFASVLLLQIVSSSGQSIGPNYLFDLFSITLKAFSIVLGRLLGLRYPSFCLF
jgi:hypothetical protein